MTQKERLLEYLKEYIVINPLESWRILGIYRLGARVFDLKKDGHVIETNKIKVKNRFGEDCLVAEYRLMSERFELEG